MWDRDIKKSNSNEILIFFEAQLKLHSVIRFLEPWKDKFIILQFLYEYILIFLYEYGNFIAGDEFFYDAEKVIFVAVAEPTLRLITDKEECQIGNLFYQAERLKGVIKMYIYIYIYIYILHSQLYPRF